MNEPRLTIQTDKVQLKNSSGTEVGTTSNRLQVESRNTDTFTIFNDILKELKKINLSLALITDTKIENLDVEV